MNSGVPGAAGPSGCVIFAARILIVLSLSLKYVPGHGFSALIWLRISCAGLLKSIWPSSFAIFLQKVAL